MIKGYKKAVENYVIESLEISVKDFFECYNSEFNNEYEKRRILNEQTRISEYLKGLPSCINIAFYNCDILELAKVWGLNLDTERKEDAFLASYWRRIAKALMDLNK